jgi:PGF-pre-PGF domain-containing protein
MTSNLTLASGLTYEKDINDLSNGNYKYYVRCNDSLGNVMASSENISFTVSISSGGSGGGGGGSTTSGTSHKWSALEVGDSASMELTSSNVITELSFVAEEKSTNVEMSVNPSDNNPSVETPLGKVYKYFDISTKNLKSITSGKIRFTVKKLWFLQNKIDENNVVLMRFKNTVWNELDTKKISDDFVYVDYEASVPGFSYFAITTKGEIEETPVTNKTENKSEEIETTGIVPLEENKELENQTKEYEEKIKNLKPEPVYTNYFGSVLVVFILIIFIANLVLYFAIIQKKRKGEDFFS